MSRLLELRNLILGSLELAKLSGKFGMEENFVISPKWFPADELPEIASNSGSIYVFGRPASSSRMTRTGADLIHEELIISFTVLFSSGPDDETENHIAFTEAVQDHIRATAELNDFVWSATQPARDANGLPYSYFEMARGAFCAQFEMTFTVTRNGG